MPTAQISLIREQTAAIRPPRALWVPFMMGRPFGVPNDAAFQCQGAAAPARACSNAASGPVLEDYPEDAPSDPADESGYVCPVSFVGEDPRAADLGDALLREVEQLEVWYEQAKRRRRRSTVGIAGMSIRDAARFVGSQLTDSPMQNPQADVSLGVVLKRCCDDLKAYYFEALSAQPGALSARAVDEAFWRDSVAGRIFIALRERGLRHPDKSFAAMAERSLVPRRVLHTVVGQH